MSIQPRTETVDIFQGDYLARLRHLEARYEAELQAEEIGPPRTNDEIPTSEKLLEEHKALRAEAEASKIVVKVGTVRRSVYRSLVDEHPPREGNKGDDAMGVNEATFREALVPVAIVDVTEAGETRAWADIPESEREEFLDCLAQSDFMRLFYAAFGLVNGFAQDPKALDRRSPTTSRPDEN